MVFSFRKTGRHTFIIVFNIRPSDHSGDRLDGSSRSDRDWLDRRLVLLDGEPTVSGLHLWREGQKSDISIVPSPTSSAAPPSSSTKRKKSPRVGRSHEGYDYTTLLGTCDVG